MPSNFLQKTILYRIKCKHSLEINKWQYVLANNQTVLTLLFSLYKYNTMKNGVCQPFCLTFRHPT